MFLGWIFRYKPSSYWGDPHLWNLHSWCYEIWHRDFATLMVGVGWGPGLIGVGARSSCCLQIPYNTLLVANKTVCKWTNQWKYWGNWKVIPTSGTQNQIWNIEEPCISLARRWTIFFKKQHLIPLGKLTYRCGKPRKSHGLDNDLQMVGFPRLCEFTRG